MYATAPAGPGRALSATADLTRITLTPTLPQSRYRELALEQTTDELFAVAAQSAVFRDLSKLAIETIVARDRQIASLRRQLAAVKDEYRAHRERTMRASVSGAVTSEVPKSPMQSISEPAPTRTYTTKHGSAEGTQYIPLANTTGPQHGADA